jgi:hypothetical protein
VLICDQGNIGSTEGGLPFLEDEEIVEIIVEIAEQSPVLIMKGTCFFVLGLISSTRMGAELLEELGWVSTRTPMGHTTGICLPNDISRFVQVSSGHSAGRRSYLPGELSPRHVPSVGRLDPRVDSCRLVLTLGTDRAVGEDGDASEHATAAQAHGARGGDHELDCES